ncbi:metabolite traffic protein EboE [Algoriphagus marincola]|uniref:Metabolite traffic protein EboE n=1 Tax=Algoriphagus marincola TaxID=264027 RepID=A0ABS7N4V2_9BACT|nr:metabolite traffic protein EboE [Algoriphagus marincola]MBY5951357.1 metabolite traffic protein EboE [Algoriphagus marincola]
MHIGDFHLSYCSNIHPGESWKETFENLKKYIPQVRQNLSWEGAFGIGLRLSHEASLELQNPENLKAFQQWLESANAYVFTLNCFPYGSFHHTAVKDKVHQPDWTTKERKEYTIRSFRLLAELLPSGQEGGISTSPVSYRYWFPDKNSTEAALETAVQNFAEVVAELEKIERETGKYLHLDIEPEPDGILENSDEMIWFFQDWMLIKGAKYLYSQYGFSLEKAKELIRRHIQVCYDVCHFAIVYEKPEVTFEKFAKAGIKVGKIQVSAALQVKLDQDRDAIRNQLEAFAESTYLHQVVGRKMDGDLVSYSDLPEALEQLDTAVENEWRIHFHVPLFVEKYGQFFSTQSQIVEVLEYLKQNPALCKHLEVETYTWEVLPTDMQVRLDESISRELSWVLERLI